MTRSYIDDLLKPWHDSIAKNYNSIREMEKVVNFSGGLDKAMKQAMGLDLDLRSAMGLDIAQAIGSVRRPELVEFQVKAKQAMGLDLDLKSAMGLDIAQAISSVRRPELLELQVKARGELLRTQKELAETNRLLVQSALDSVYLRAAEDLTASLNRIADGDLLRVKAFTDRLASIELGIQHVSSWAKDSFEALTRDLYDPGFGGFRPQYRTPSEWIDEELDLLWSPKYTQSKLAWILDLFVPRLRLALYKQEQEGDFDGVMEEFWKKLVQDPEVRLRLRERIEKSGIREELRKCLSSHLEKVGEGEWLYAILGLYAHIEAFLAELAVQNGLIPDPEIILCPKNGKKSRRSGVDQLIIELHRGGKISRSQERFLKYVLSNEYNSNRVRHGTCLEFSPARATALVLALILALCLAWGLEPPELLQPEKEQN